MKYYQTKKFPKSIGLAGLITIVSCLIIAIGAFSWLALSKDNKVIETPKEENPNSSYVTPYNSYNNEVKLPDTDDVNESTEDVPYGNEATTESTVEKQTFILPIDGKISKGYSDTALQYSATYGDMRLHTGIDIECNTGSEIKAVSTGVVSSVIEDAKFGRTIVIDHGDGLTVKYCGMGSVNIKEGDSVTPTTVIGTSGDIPAECSDNPHIHIEAIVNEKAVSPLKAFELE